VWKCLNPLIQVKYSYSSMRGTPKTPIHVGPIAKFPFANRQTILYSGILQDPHQLIKRHIAQPTKRHFLNLIIFKDVMMKTIFTLLALFVFTGTAVVVPQSNVFAAEFANKGKVLETMDASIYTYMQVTSDKGPVWIAASKTKVAKGETISYPDGAVMTNFNSKSLNRTFDKIIFVDKITVVKK
jgi:hypothetical protein